MIVKVQLPLSSNQKDPPAFIYDEKKEVEMFVPITKELLEHMDGEPKKYFKAHILKDGTLMLDEEAEEQSW